MEHLLEMENITKSFPGVKALQNVTLHVKKGEVLALVGENGAGKSTLMKVLSGAYSRDSGTIRIDGETINNATPKQMIDLGVAIIYQEMTLAPHLTVAENIYMGQMPKTRFGTIDWAIMKKHTNDLGKTLGLGLDAMAQVNSLSVAKRQMVEIAKALNRNARLIVLDEPSAVLGDNEIQGLFKVVRKLTENGVAFIYISHRLNEIFHIADNVTVMKDGQVVDTRPVGELDNNKLVRLMVGRELSDIYPKREFRPGSEALRITNLTNHNVKDINLSVREGEILGIAGLAGAGRSELLRAIVGYDPIEHGQIEVYGEKTIIRTPGEAIKFGIGMLPEDRKTEGLFLTHPLTFNVTIPKLSSLIRTGRIRFKEENEHMHRFVKELDIRPQNIHARIRNLSGGNQQKCMFARWLFAGSKILFIDEPTRGVDVGAKREIYRLIADLTDKGVAVIMVSSELPEVLGLSDRILVMHEGRIQGELQAANATEEKIMKLAIGEGAGIDDGNQELQLIN